MKRTVLGAVLSCLFPTLCAAAAGEDPPAGAAFQPAEPISLRPGSGITFDGGDDFRLNLLNRLQVQYQHSFGADAREGFMGWLEDDEDNNQDFEVRRARTRFSGHAFHTGIRYQLEMDWTEVDEEGALLDAWTQWNFLDTGSEWIGLRFGQGKTHHGLEATGTSAGLAMVERSIATNLFSNRRAQGAWLNGQYGEGVLRWFAGVQDSFVAGGLERFTTGWNTTEDNEVVYVASMQLDVLGDFLATSGGEDYEAANQGDVGNSPCLLGTFGGGVAYDDRGVGSLPPPAPVAIDQSTSWNANTAWRYAGWWATAEYYRNRTDFADGTEPVSDGYHLAVNYSFPKSGDSRLQWGLGARYADIQLGNDFGALVPGGLQGDSVDQIGGVLTAYVRGHTCKVQAEVNRTSFGDQDVDQVLIQVSLIL